MTRLSAINTLEEGGIKMIDIEIMIKASRLAWLKRIFNNNDSTWKFYLIHLLIKIGDLLIFQCNYAIKDLQHSQLSIENFCFGGQNSEISSFKRNTGFL